jgi:hypothetical protein
MRPFILIAVVAAAVGFADVGKPSPQGVKQERVTLLGILSQWQYPGSKMLDGATMRDGGNPMLPSTFCHAVLTTPDPVEKVVAFYKGKSDPAPDKETSVPRKPLKAIESSSVLVQDDSKNRKVAVKVIVVVKADSSTTLVVTRAASESETHIAWTHHLRHNVGR